MVFFTLSVNVLFFSTTTTGCLEAGHMVAGLLRVLEDHSITMTLPPLTSDAIEKVGKLL